MILHVMRYRTLNPRAETYLNVATVLYTATDKVLRIRTLIVETLYVSISRGQQKRYKWVKVYRRYKMWTVTVLVSALETTSH